MANSDDKKSDEVEELLARQRKILETPSEGQFAMFRDYVFDSFGEIFARLRHLRACLPLRPWMLNAGASIGVVGFLAGFAWLLDTRMQAHAGYVKAVEACEMAEAAIKQDHNHDVTLRSEIKPLSEGMAVTNAKLDMLLEARGMSGPSKDRIRESQRALGFTPDSVNQDSALHGSE